ncbi:MAG: hypothetical protein KC457_30765 [Myxococcales bacterium]|nr:hypothetical protein [Myxococcales bacterium]
MSLPSSSLPRLPGTILATGLIAGAFTMGCYGVDFDAQKSDVYYCTSDEDCGADQACSEFRCVDNRGPALDITLPEELTPYPTGADTININFNVDDLELSDSTSHTEGSGMVAILVDGEQVSTSTSPEGAIVTLPEPLVSGGHQVAVQAIYGDGEPYENPGAFAFTAVFVQDENPNRPQVTMLQPEQGHRHVLGEDMDVEIATRNFTLVSSSALCTWEADCDPFVLGSACVPADECNAEIPPTEGHVHLYLLDNYPDCLLTPNILDSCNGDYALAMVPGAEGIEGDEERLRGKIPAEEFTAPGTYKLTVSLQYGHHPPFPNPQFVIHNSIEIEVVER